MSTHSPTLCRDGYVRCPVCPAWRAGPFGPQSLLAAGVAQTMHHIAVALAPAAKTIRSTWTLAPTQTAPPIEAVAAAERAKLQRWWKREADAMWSRHGLERPKP